MDFIIVESEYL